MTQGTEKRFGYEWNIYREILPEHRRQFIKWIAPFDIESFKGRRFLDAGCGMGRNSLWALKSQASSGVAFDFDERTIEAARGNLSAFPNCDILLQSIYEITYRDNFDIVFSMGVLHHLEDPKKAVWNLVRALKPGGTLILWVYAREGNELFLRFVDPLRKYITSRLPPFITRLIAKVLTVFVKIYLLFPHRDEYLSEMKCWSLGHIEGVVFDQLLPHIANYWQKWEVADLVSHLPVKISHLTHTNGMSWTLIAEKEKYYEEEL